MTLPRGFLLPALALCVVFPVAASPASAREERGRLEVPYLDHTRVARYVLDIPDKKPPAMLVVSLHGAFLNERVQASVWRDASRAAGAALLCPKSRGVRWTHDDLPMLDAVLDHALARLSMDPPRVFLTGFSSGGWMSYLWAASKPRRFSGVVPMAAGWNDESRGAIREAPGALPPFLLMHGLEDRLVSAKLAREAAGALRGRAADVTLVEIPGLGHLVPRSRLGETLAWMASHRARSAAMDPLDIDTIPRDMWPTTLRKNEKAPPFNITSVQGTVLRRDELDGGLVVLFSGSGSGGGAQRRRLESLAGTWKDRARLLVVMRSIPLGATGERMIRSMGVKFPIIKDASGILERSFGVRRTPCTLIFNRELRLVDFGPKPRDMAGPAETPARLDRAFRLHFGTPNQRRQATRETREFYRRLWEKEK